MASKKLLIIPKMEVRNVKTADLKPYKNNPKKHPDKQIEAIADSISKFGFKQPIVIDKQNNVVVGHGRLFAAKKLELKEVPCVRADDLTEKQIKEYRIVDNKLNESDWDIEALELELVKLPHLKLEFKNVIDLSTPEDDEITFEEGFKDTLPSNLCRFICDDIRGTVEKKDAERLKELLKQAGDEGYELLADKFNYIISLLNG